MEPGPAVIKLEYSPKLKQKRNDWMLADTGRNDWSASSQSLRFILNLKNLMKCCSVKSHLNGILLTGRPWPESVCCVCVCGGGGFQYILSYLSTRSLNFKRIQFNFFGF